MATTKKISEIRSQPEIYKPLTYWSISLLTDRSM